MLLCFQHVYIFALQGEERDLRTGCNEAE
jgi:hypothetical protein